MEEKEKLRIIDTEWGIANRFLDGTIEINKNLRKYPRLFRPILQHELSHTDKSFSTKDFWHDINSEHKVDQIQLLKFMFRHPKSFTQLLPFYYTKRRKFVIDINLSIIYSIMFLITLAIYLFLF